MPSSFMKDPDAKLDYKIDWSDWLDGDTISASTWTVPAGLTKVSDTFSNTTATIWLSGGTAGLHYEVTNRITTGAGRIDDRTLSFRIREN
jgi:hypothetical protein